MNAERTVPTLLNQIREELLPLMARSPEIQTVENLQLLRSRLHSLHYYCVRAQIPDAVCDHVEVLLSTSADYWRLIAENETLLINLKDFRRVRTSQQKQKG